jgi:hypothetical protein
MAEVHILNGFQVVGLFFYSKIYSLFTVLPLFLFVSGGACQVAARIRTA